jgi:hypothetical protein
VVSDDGPEVAFVPLLASTQVPFLPIYPAFLRATRTSLRSSLSLTPAPFSFISVSCPSVDGVLNSLYLFADMTHYQGGSNTGHDVTSYILAATAIARGTGTLFEVRVLRNVGNGILTSAQAMCEVCSYLQIYEKGSSRTTRAAGTASSHS